MLAFRSWRPPSEQLCFVQTFCPSWTENTSGLRPTSIGFYKWWWSRKRSGCIILVEDLELWFKFIIDMVLLDERSTRVLGDMLKFGSFVSLYYGKKSFRSESILLWVQRRPFGLCTHTCLEIDHVRVRLWTPFHNLPDALGENLFNCRVVHSCLWRQEFLHIDAV